MKIDFSPPFINQDIKKEVMDVLESGWITTGPKVKELENLISTKYNIPACLGVNSWTSGVIMFLKWWGINEGDEVIIPAYTYAATALAVIHAGATPVIIDVKDDFTMDETHLAKSINEKTKVIIPVDVGGIVANYTAINQIVKLPENVAKFNPQSVHQQRLGRILVLADAAHSIGAKMNGDYSGTLCDVSVFSLHAVKNITSAEGGIIALNLPHPFNNEELYPLLRRFSLNGQTKDAFTKTKAGAWKYDIVEVGMKCNLPDLNAALALGQLKQYDELLKKRKDIHDQYTFYFSHFDWAILPEYRDSLNRSSSYHIYNIRLTITEERRDEIIQYMSRKGVAVNVHFIPLPMLTIFQTDIARIHSYKNAYHQYIREISLPIYPQLTSSEVAYICNCLREAYYESEVN